MADAADIVLRIDAGLLLVIREVCAIAEEAIAERDKARDERDELAVKLETQRALLTAQLQVAQEDREADVAQLNAKLRQAMRDAIQLATSVTECNECYFLADDMIARVAAYGVELGINTTEVLPHG